MNPEDVMIETLCSVPVKSVPSGVVQFLDFVDTHYNRIPPELTGTAKVLIDAVDHPGARFPEVLFVMTYERPMTIEEREAIATSRAKTLLDFEERERAELARLTAKYGEAK